MDVAVLSAGSDGRLALSTPEPTKYPGVPTTTTRPETFPVTPAPGVETKSWQEGKLSPLAALAATIADASGCSLCASTAAATARRSSLPRLPAETMLTSRGLP